MKYLDALDGISYERWEKLKLGIDRQFEQQKKELNKTIQLSSCEAAKLIRSQFGDTLD